MTTLPDDQFLIAARTALEARNGDWFGFGNCQRLVALAESTSQALEALRLTVEHVGLDVLPPVEGWSWYDTLRQHPQYEGWLQRMTQLRAVAEDPAPPVAPPPAKPGRKRKLRDDECHAGADGVCEWGDCPKGLVDGPGCPLAEEAPPDA